MRETLLMFKLARGVRHPRRLLVRRSMFRLSARLIGGFLPLCLLAPIFLCGADAVTPQDASSCCRTMKFACHQGDAYSACCERQVPAPARVAVVTPVRKATGLQPMQAASLLPAAPVTRTFCGSHRTFSASDAGPAPPGDVPLFLLHSILLI
ncbi:MAG TPA: hypothetical protein VG204_10220 [Terriglobia bacterium]|nr:hypothetical protein [Terriglobia bacterium]